MSGIHVQSFSDELLKIAKDAETKPAIGKQEIKGIRRDIELWNKLRGSTPIKIQVDAKADKYGGGYFDQIAKEIGISRKDYETLAHELGHAEMDKRLWGRIIQHPISRGVFPWTPVAGALGGVLLSKGKKMGLLLPLATATPTLISEGMATSKGSKLLKDIGATKKEVDKYKKEMDGAFGSYSASIPMAAMAAMLAHSIASQ